ncbi:hypothetical protein R1flu_001699 [Riccia fluitans]|uniref:Reverse transcriptase domain-containing protein n=1 Tax=Riccia fluitans TaxID=41844 RepID=A0ABD1Y404_9MARC
MTIEALRALGEEGENDVLECILEFWKDNKNVIHPQQKDFIRGRAIADNLLAVRTDQEWALKSKQKILLIKLEFEKVYDRIEHRFLWDAMKAMNITSAFSDMAKGLVEGASSKIGRLQGLQITPTRSMLYQLFADDSAVKIRAEGEEYEELHDAVRVYERISGTKLNVRKSKVIPIGLSEIPYWLRDMGRSLNTENSLLSFAGRAVVLQHILSSNPVHILSCITFHQHSLQKLEAIGRLFLWGLGREGRPRIPLIAWSELQKQKGDGGLNLISFDTQGKAMRMRQCAKMLTATTERLGYHHGANLQKCFKFGVDAKLVRRQTSHTIEEWKAWALSSPERLNRYLDNTFSARQGKTINVTEEEDWSLQMVDCTWQPKHKVYRGLNQPTQIWKALANIPEQTDNFGSGNCSKLESPHSEEWLSGAKGMGSANVVKLLKRL